MLYCDMKNIEDIVFKLNNEIWEQNNKLIEEGLCTLTSCSDGYSVGIKFLGAFIWDSENDNRPCGDDTEEYIDLELYLRMKMNEIIKEICKLKIV
jgi:hypothetical protein